MRWEIDATYFGNPGQATARKFWKWYIIDWNTAVVPTRHGDEQCIKPSYVAIYYQVHRIPWTRMMTTAACNASIRLRFIVGITYCSRSPS
jgi:hypothetical protein